MKKMISWLSKPSLKKLSSFALLLAFGFGITSPVAEARLIFTTENDGVEAEDYALDVDGSVAANENTDIQLRFGSNLSASISYNDSTDKFTINQNVDFSGKDIIDFRVESAATASAPTCSVASDSGRLYYDTTVNQMFVCTGTAGWDSVEDIAAGGITSSQIADGTITADDLATDSVGSDEIATGAVGSDEILDGSIGTSDLANNSVDGTKLSFSGETTGDIAYYDGTDWVRLGIGTAGQVLTTNAGANSPTWANAAASGAANLSGLTDVTLGTLASGNVLVYNATSGSWENVAVSGDATLNTAGAFSLAADSVGASEIATGAVGSDELAADSVGSSEIATGAVGSDEIADGSITASDLDSGFTITGANITDGTITAADLGTNSVDSDEIATGAVGSDELAANSVGASEIATGAVGSDEILDGSITSADLATRNFTAVLPPEFPNFTIHADGSSNLGTLESDYSTTDNRNFYQWSTRQATIQDYDLVVQWPVPSDFTGFQATNPIQFDYKTTNTTLADNQLDIVNVLDTAGNALTLTGDSANLVNTNWTTANVGYTGTPTFTPGEFITLRFNLQARKGTVNTNAFLGALKFNYQAK